MKLICIYKICALLQVRARVEEAEAMATKNTSLAKEAGSAELVMTTIGNLLGIKQKDVRTTTFHCK